jgi:hypothetical protein
MLPSTATDNLIGSKTVKKKLFLDDPVAESVVGRIAGQSSGCFGSAMATPEVLSDSAEHSD